MMLPLLAFAFGSLIVMAAAYALMPKRASAIDRRIEELTAGRETAAPAERKVFTAMVGMVKRVGERAPINPKELGQLLFRLVQAGYRRPEAVAVFFGIRVMLALGLFLLLSSLILMPAN